MKIRVAALLLLCSLYLEPVAAQHLEHCVLWRITGNKLKNPSYLFGTIHLRTKKLFDFPDSLYTAISNTEVFTLEFNPDSMNSGLGDYLSKLMSEDQTSSRREQRYEKRIKDVLSKSELKTLKDNVDAGSKINVDDLTLRELYLIKDKIVRRRKRNDDMPTFMDAFLYTIAKDKDRIIGGLELVGDQMKLMGTSAFTDVDRQKMLEFYKNGESMEDQLIRLYLDKDLDKIQQIAEMYDVEAEKLILSNRNKVMLRSMDSIMQKNSLFSAVGTMHLTGKLGLITLLREKGYNVEPVVCESTTSGSDYEFKKKEPNWVTVNCEKDGYAIKMPGTPTDLDAESGIVKMKMYIDLTESRYFITSHIPRSDKTRSLEETIENMATAMLRAAQNAEVKNISQGDLTGREYFYDDKDKMHYHVQIFGDSTDIYMLMAYGKSNSIRRVDSFFGTFRLVPKSKLRLISKTFEDIHTTVTIPDTKPARSSSYESDSSTKQTLYTIVDPDLGSYYFVACLQTMAGYNYVKNSVWLESVKSTYAKLGAELITLRKKFRQFDADEFESKEISGSKAKGILVYAGNRVYKYIVQAPANPAAAAATDSFLNSIVITTPPPGVLFAQTIHNGACSLAAPDSLKPTKSSLQDTTTGPGEIKEHTYQCWDKVSLVTYDVGVKRLSAYYWQSHDTLMVKNWLKKNFGNEDSAAEYKYYHEGDLVGGEATGRKKQANVLRRIKVIGDGRTRYTIECTFPDWMAHDQNIEGFFSSFKVLKRETEKLQPSPAQFFKDLHSKDAGISKKAKKEKNEVFMSEADRALFVQQLSTTFPDDTNYDYETADYLFDMIESFDRGLPLKDVEQLYHSEGIVKRGFQLKVLANMGLCEDSVAAFQKIKELMLNSRPKKYQFCGLHNALMNHPSLTKTFFPDWLQLADDSVCRIVVDPLLGELVDSGLLDRSVIAPHLPMLIEKSKATRAKSDGYTDGFLFDLLGHFSTPEVWKELEQYQFVQNNSMRLSAVRKLTDSNIKPNADIVDSLASDKYYRLEIYKLLTEKFLMKMFPKKYLNQQAFAESYIASYDDDGIYTQFIPLGMKRTLHNGRKQKFFLFELTTDDSTGKSYLGVAGPFSEDVSIPAINEEANVVGVADDPLDKKDLDNQLRMYLISRKIGKARE